MKALHDLAATLAEQSKSQTGSTTSSDMDSRKNAPSAWVAAIFRRMQAIYGSRWTASIEGIESDAVREWTRALGGLSPDQIRRGLDSLKTQWPPTLPEFRALCEGKSLDGKNEHGLNYTPQVYRQSVPMNRVLDKPRDEEAGKAACSEILRMLGRRA